MTHKARIFVTNIDHISKYIEEIDYYAKEHGVYTEHHLALTEYSAVLITRYDSTKEFIDREHNPDSL